MRLKVNQANIPLSVIKSIVSLFLSLFGLVGVRPLTDPGLYRVHGWRHSMRQQNWPKIKLIHLASTAQFGLWSVFSPCQQQSYLAQWALHTAQIQQPGPRSWDLGMSTQDPGSSPLEVAQSIAEHTGSARLWYVSGAYFPFQRSFGK